MKRIQIAIDTSARGAAPQGMTNFHTLLPVALWRGEPVELAVGLFSATDTPDAMTDVTEMKLEISTDAAHTTPIVTSTATVANTRLDLSITNGDWNDGVAQHGIFPLAKGDLDPTMDSASRLDLWMRVTMIKDTEWIVLSNSSVVCHEAGAWPV